MPWCETTPMRERLEFLRDHQRGLSSFAALCRHYEISRKTGYKWLTRFGEEGLSGLADRSRAPRTPAHQVEACLVDALLEIRRRHPSWGPRKIVAYLHAHNSALRWPAASTVGEILRRHGLTHPRRRCSRPGHPGAPLSAMDSPNAVWTADFKGHFKTRDGRYCYPLTVVDGFSRYLLACQALISTEHELAKPVFERLFREYGLPTIIRSDNGVPFATQAIGRISRLSAWWIKLGITPETIEPSHPEQNGRHERMRRTLKAEATLPPATTCAAQQRVFHRFRIDYNEERPHEALGNNTPSTLYRPSTRPLPARVPTPEYPVHFEVRRVSHNGGIRWKHSSSVGPNNGWLFISQVLNEEPVGLEEIHDGIWSVYFGPVLLGRFDERELKLYGAHKARPATLSPMSPV